MTGDHPRLEVGTVQIVWFALDLPPSRVRDLEASLSLAERERAHRFHIERDRDRFIVARGRLRGLLGHYTAQSADQIAFVSGPHGKPSLGPGSVADGLRFNLSRSDAVGVVALGLDDELGMDVERIRPFADALAIAEQFFTGAEHCALRGLPEGEQVAAFFSLWTRKEAVVKSVGRGLTHPLDAFELSSDGRDAECVDLDCDGARMRRWLVPVPPPGGDWVAALATAGPPPAVCSRTWPDEWPLPHS